MFSYILQFLQLQHSEFLTLVFVMNLLFSSIVYTVNEPQSVIDVGLAFMLITQHQRALELLGVCFLQLKWTN